jgi:transketolase
MIGVATGLALKGFRTFVTSFAPFATARCCEQIKVNLGEMQTPVIVIGIASGFEMEYFGNSHYGYDDIAFMRSISGLTILCPADTTELVKMLRELMTINKPVYLRLTRTTKKSLIYKQDYEYRIGKANILSPIGDITIISTGSIVSVAKSVAERIEKERGVSCGVVDMHTIKPLDEETILSVCKRSSLMVTLEEHNIIGGLGTAVAEKCASFKNETELLAVGVPDKHRHVGEYDFLMKAYGLDEDSVFNKIMQRWDNRYDV